MPRLSLRCFSLTIRPRGRQRLAKRSMRACARVDRSRLENPSDLIDKAISRLGVRNTFPFGDRNLVVACSIRSATGDRSRLSSGAKRAYIIGADLNGDFLLRHCDGSVRYWHHNTQARRDTRAERSRIPQQARVDAALTKRAVVFGSVKILYVTPAPQSCPPPSSPRPYRTRW